MNYSISISDTAKQDLGNIAIWIAKQSKNINIAKKFIDDLTKEYARLAQFPNIGSYPKDYFLRSLGYKFIVFKDYLTFYTIDESKKVINIEAVVNAKRDYMHILTRYLNG